MRTKRLTPENTASPGLTKHVQNRYKDEVFRKMSLLIDSCQQLLHNFDELEDSKVLIIGQLQSAQDLVLNHDFVTHHLNPATLHEYFTSIQTAVNQDQDSLTAQVLLKDLLVTLLTNHSPSSDSHYECDLAGEYSELVDTFR